MEKIIYVKIVENYNEIVKYKVPLILKKIIFYFKKLFNIVTKMQLNGNVLWILPFKDTIEIKKLEKIIVKDLNKIKENITVVLSSKLKKKEFINIINKYNIKYVKGNLAKKKLVFKILQYINTLQNTELNKRDIVVMANKDTNINIKIIERLAVESKSIKIVSKNNSKFKKLEQKLYNDKGIAIQFSNSYKKSLKNANIIINLDFNETEINEYYINSNAIIINTENKMKIKSNFFNGIIINSCKIHISQYNMSKEFDNLDVYESLLIGSSEYMLNENNIKIEKVIGTNGIILEKEFKNMC